MLQIDKIKLPLPKWKWWQFLLVAVSVILACKIDPSQAFELLQGIIGQVVRSP